MYSDVFVKHFVKGLGQTTGAMFLTGVFTGLYLLLSNYVKDHPQETPQEPQPPQKEHLEFQEEHQENDKIYDLSNSELFLAKSHKFKSLFDN